MTEFEEILETILEEYARRDTEGDFDTWEETDSFVKEKAEVLLAYANLKEEPVSEELEEAVNAYIGHAPDIDECSSVYGKRQAFKAGAKWLFERVNEALLSEVLPCFMHGGEADEVVAKLDEALNQKK